MNADPGTPETINQRRLLERDQWKGKSNADGIWGSKSQAALDAYKASQTKPKSVKRGNNSEDDGQSWGQRLVSGVKGLFSGDDEGTEDQTTITKPKSVKKVSLNNLGDMSSYSKDQIKGIQQKLISMGLLSDGSADGVWGKLSQAAYDKYLENTVSDRISQNIPFVSKTASFIGQVADHGVNQLSRIYAGFEDNPISLLYGPVVSGVKAWIDGTKAGNQAADEMEAARKSGVRDSDLPREKLVQTDILSGTGLTNAEKRQAYAILVNRNNNQPITYESYLADLKKNGGNDGWVGLDKSSYHFSNRQENKRDMDTTTGSLGLIGNIINTGKRMFSDPNRGRLGSWSYRVKEDGTIEIRDRFEGTEAKAATGANDSEAYSGARALWNRGATHLLNDTISAAQANRWYAGAAE